ncbi:MAG: hypothetical protein J5525_12205 [Lachnospiraceae bacterium]|nr:hypothetical protein [Lachnospiraceae bacterium]
MRIEPRKIETTAICPKCHSYTAMRLSNDPHYSFQCIVCNKTYNTAEIKETYMGVFEISVPAGDNFYDSHETSLEEIRSKYDCTYMASVERIEKSIKKYRVEYAWKDGFPESRKLQQMYEDLKAIK